MKFIIPFLLFSCSSNINTELTSEKDTLKNLYKSEKSSEIKLDSTASGIENNSIKGSIGIIKLEFKDVGKLKIYDENGGLWNVIDLNASKPDLNDSIKPFSVSLDYYVLIFKCTKEETDLYEIVVDERKGLKKYIAKGSGVIFETWKKHIINVFAVGFNQDMNPIRKAPILQADIIEKQTDDFYLPVKIEGDWLQVKWGEEDKWKFGWIKWRENENLLIELFYYA